MEHVQSGSSWNFELCHLESGICVFMASGYRLTLPNQVICVAILACSTFFCRLCHWEDCGRVVEQRRLSLPGCLRKGWRQGRGNNITAVSANLKLSVLFHEKKGCNIGWKFCLTLQVSTDRKAESSQLNGEDQARACSADQAEHVMTTQSSSIC